MTRTIIRFSTTLIALWAVVASSVAAQETPAPNAAMREMMKLMMPGEGHKFFAPLAGKWRGKMKVWNYMTPTAPPTESDTESESKLMLGGRFLLEEATGTVMNMQMKRMSILGYDNFTKKFTLVFYSSMGTATDIATGTLDADGKTLTLRGAFDDPTGKIPYKNVVRIDGDTSTFESYRVMPDGSERKAVEQTMTRAK